MAIHSKENATAATSTGVLFSLSRLCVLGMFVVSFSSGCSLCNKSGGVQSTLREEPGGREVKGEVKSVWKRAKFLINDQFLIIKSKEKLEEANGLIAELSKSANHPVGKEFRPFCIWEHSDNNKGSRIFVLSRTKVISIPDNGEVLIFSVSHGNKVSLQQFSVGWRSEMADAELRLGVIGDQALLLLRTKPVMGSSKTSAYFARLDDHWELVRYEDERGILIRNDYTSPNHRMGDDVDEKIAAYWKAEISSKSEIRVLRALTWLGGKHKTKAKVESGDKDSIARILLSDQETYNLVLNASKHDHPWLREAANTALREFKIGR